jgi:hypothetical protein
MRRPVRCVSIASECGSGRRFRALPIGRWFHGSSRASLRALTTSKFGLIPAARVLIHLCLMLDSTIFLDDVMGELGKRVVLHTGAFPSQKGLDSRTSQSLYSATDRSISRSHARQASSVQVSNSRHHRASPGCRCTTAGVLL